MNKVSVVAKKINITKSVIDQLLSPSLSEIKKGVKVLGWCNWILGTGKFKKNKRLVVLVNGQGDIRRWIMPDRFEVSDDSKYNQDCHPLERIKDPWRLSVFRSSMVTDTMKFETQSERDQVLEELENLKSIAVEVGQFLY